MSDLTRDRQRTIGALKLSTQASRDEGKSTLIDTIHCGADMMDWLVIEGGMTSSDYEARARRRMAQEGRAMPDGSFPIGTREDLEVAIKAAGRAPDQKAVTEFIRRRAFALGAEGVLV